MSNYYYKDDFWDNSNYVSNRLKPIKWNQDVVSYYKKLWNFRKLTPSPLPNKIYQPTNRGYYDLTGKVEPLPSEQDLHGRNIPGYHEKAWPNRVNLTNENGEKISHYTRMFSMDEGIWPASSKIIANLVCGRLFPTKMSYYAIKNEGEFGTLGIDLNNLDGVKSIRLDKYLDSKGIELNSFVDMMKAYNSGAFKDDLTKTGIAQLMLGMSAIPNSIGEQDPNTRNAILLGPDVKSKKFDSLVRIDFENNRINNSPNQQTSYTQTGDTIRVYPFGIYSRDESKIEFKENIVKAVVDKDLSIDDAKLILSLHEVAKYATESRTNVDNAITDAINSHKYFDEQSGFKERCEHGSFAANEYEQFGESIIERARNYTDNINKYFDNAGVHNSSFTLPDITPEA